eukprot:3159101-Prymnesium_polylepis.1
MSCGSEADNHAIVGALQVEEARRREAGEPPSPPPHIVTSVIEHPAVIECLKALEAVGRVAVTWLGVDESGRVSATEVATAVTTKTVLVTIMHSNNEVGSLQPIGEIVRLLRTCSLRPDVLVHTVSPKSGAGLKLASLAQPPAPRPCRGRQPSPTPHRRSARL